MAFTKKTWVDRLVEFAGRRKITNVSTLQAQIVDVERVEGVVSQEGSAFSAANMNDLEQRIADGIAGVERSVNQVSSELEKKVSANSDAHLNGVYLRGSNIALVYSEDDNVNFQYKNASGSKAWANIKDIVSNINDIRSSFQAGVDTLYSKCVSCGWTPSGKTPTAISDAIQGIYGNRYTEGYNNGYNAGKLKIPKVTVSSIGINDDPSFPDSLDGYVARMVIDTSSLSSITLGPIQTFAAQASSINWNYARIRIYGNNTLLHDVRNTTVQQYVDRSYDVSGYSTFTVDFIYRHGLVGYGAQLVSVS